jgi:hypothetical protein
MQPKTQKILYWAITIIFALFMAFSGISELLQIESAKQVLTALGYPTYVNYILGIAKLLGVIAILQWRFKTIKEWAYAGFTIDILGATASNFFVEGIGPALMTVIFFIPLFLSYWLWKKTEAKQ